MKTPLRFNNKFIVVIKLNSSQEDGVWEILDKLPKQTVIKKYLLDIFPQIKLKVSLSNLTCTLIFKPMFIYIQMREVRAKK
jgi:hypothetical protein